MSNHGNKGNIVVCLQVGELISSSLSIRTHHGRKHYRRRGLKSNLTIPKLKKEASGRWLMAFISKVTIMIYVVIVVNYIAISCPGSSTTISTPGASFFANSTKVSALCSRRGQVL